MLPAVALKVVVVALAETSTGPATGSSALLLESVTDEPPAGAALLMVTVHVVDAPDPRLAGLQDSADTTVAVIRLTVAACDEPFKVAVMVALWSLGMLPAVALKV